MKQIFTFAVATFLSASALAGLPNITPIERSLKEGGILPLALSPDGKYVCGSTELTQLPFCANWATQEVFTYPTNPDLLHYEDTGSELEAVVNDGTALGFDDEGILFMDSNTGVITRFNCADADLQVINKGSAAYSMTPDKSILVGFAKLDPNGDKTDGKVHAAYWENGQCHLLPEPTEAQLGIYNNGSQAHWISTDGKTIVGWLIDRMATNPLLIWHRNDQGEYDLDLNVLTDNWWDAERKNSSMKPYVRFRPEAVSPNGKTIILTLKKTPIGSTPFPNNTAYYDVATGAITTVEISGQNGIPKESQLDIYWNGVSNDGTVVGTTFTTSGSYLGFIMYPEDKQPRILSSVFTNLPKLEEYESAVDGLGENKVSAISADGTAICGAALVPDSMTKLHVSEAWVLTTGKDPSGVGSVQLPDEKTVVGYYTVSGLRLDAPAKGITIVRYSDGTSEKIFNKD